MSATAAVYGPRAIRPSSRRPGPHPFSWATPPTVPGRISWKTSTESSWPAAKPPDLDTMSRPSLCVAGVRNELPLLAIDTGMHLLNSAFNGTLYNDLPRELPEALQHRHPPERGLRHAIAITPGSRLSQLYGDGEVVVNSEHRRSAASRPRFCHQCPRPGRSDRGH